MCTADTFVCRMRQAEKMCFIICFIELSSCVRFHLCACGLVGCVERGRILAVSRQNDIARDTRPD